MKRIQVVGVSHAPKMLARTIRYLHSREPTQRFVVHADQKLDPDTPSKSKGARVGLELGQRELDLLMSGARDGKTTNNPTMLFWLIIIKYGLEYGLEFFPIDDEEAKLRHEETIKRADELRVSGRPDEARELEDESLESFIAGREIHMVERTIELETEIDVVGRAHSPDVVKLLAAREMGADEQIITDGISEFKLSDTFDIHRRFQEARLRYAAKHGFTWPM